MTEFTKQEMARLLRDRNNIVPAVATLEGNTFLERLVGIDFDELAEMSQRLASITLQIDTVLGVEAEPDPQTEFDYMPQTNRRKARPE